MVVLYQTGCAMVVSTGYPVTSHRITYVHNLFQNGAATLSGLVEMFHERIRRGELPAGRRHHLRDGDRRRRHGHRHRRRDRRRDPKPRVHRRRVRQPGLHEHGRAAQLLDAARAHDLDEPRRPRPDRQDASTTRTCRRSWRRRTSRTSSPASRASRTIWSPKAAKAQWYANHEGMAYGKLLISCPLNWRTDDRAGVDIVQAAVDSCFFPLYEIERGRHDDHLRPGGGRAAHSRRLLAEADGEDAGT